MLDHGVVNVPEVLPSLNNTNRNIPIAQPNLTIRSVAFVAWMQKSDEFWPN